MDRRGFLAGGAVASVGAAGAAVLLGAPAASATAADTTGPDEVAVPIRSLDWGLGQATAVALGEEGVSVGRFITVGPLVWMSYRLKLDTAIDPGHPLCISASDLPAAYQPRLAGTDVWPMGQAQGLGNGCIMDLSRDADDPIEPSFHPLFAGWDDFSAAGLGFAILAFGLVVAASAPSATMLLNNGVPWSDGIRAGSVIELQVMYEVTTSPVTQTSAEDVIQFGS